MSYECNKIIICIIEYTSYAFEIPGICFTFKDNRQPYICRALNRALRERRVTKWKFRELIIILFNY